MTQTRYLFKHKDNVEAQLNAGISASALTIPLKTGEGAQFPTTYGSTATSGGTSTVLNCTGIGATGVAVGDVIENVTDGSQAVITIVATDSVTTTRLKGGSDNTWQNSDRWAVNRFVITLINYDTDGITILKREKVLINSRSGDNLTVNASGRGFDGSTAQSFSTDDYVYLFMTSAALDGIDQTLSQAIRDIDQLVSQGGSEVYAADTVGTDAYAITLVPAPTAYVTGQVFNFKAGTVNTGAATLNVNGLGAKTIKKAYNADLDTGDIVANQIVGVVYDGTNFQMITQLAASGARAKVLNATRSSASGSGTQTISGVGFTPRLIQIYATTSNVGGSNDRQPSECQGAYDGVTQGTVGVGTDTTAGSVHGTPIGSTTAIVYLQPGAVSTLNAWQGVAGNIGSDGFDIVWTKTGAPGDCTMVITCIA